MGRKAPDIPLKKFAVHFPADVLIAARAAAKENSMSVSRWISLAAREKLGIYGPSKSA